MGFWIFMLIMDLLTPAIMVIFGHIFKKAAPKDINPIFGYRTTMSMKNQETWAFAHRHIGNLWFKTGMILLPVSIIPMLFVVGKSTDIIGGLGATICLIEIAVLIISIFPTDKALKNNFDENGKRIK